MTDRHRQEIETGQRFEFGANWWRFLNHLDPQRIAAAERSLRDMLQVSRLEGVKFLDAGSGSGLFSLAARRLGADVQSFDYDPRSVRCTEELRRRFFSDDPRWNVAVGSVLDRAYLESLGQFDIVYSWGVLHHTGAMWPAIENVMQVVGPGGQLFIALYNDEGRASRYWGRVKKTYVRHRLLRGPIVLAHLPYPFLAGALARLLSRRERLRGMSAWHDFIDWIGGYPFEVATPGAVVDFAKAHGFSVERLRTTNRSGCNEFVFRRLRTGPATCVA